MKRRLTAATVAAATALSLAVAPTADAANDQSRGGYQKESSSQVTDSEAFLYAVGSGIAEKLSPGAGYSPFFKGSSEAGLLEVPSNGKVIKSPFLFETYRNDANKGYKLGTTFDTIVGTGVIVAILAGLGALAAQSAGHIKF